jgi:transcriptional regulator with XRE-family HTH domain
MKTKLAGDLGVPQSRVSEWLSGKYEPSGESALRLFDWVNSWKRQHK